MQYLGTVQWLGLGSASTTPSSCQRTQPQSHSQMWQGGAQSSRNQGQLEQTARRSCVCACYDCRSQDAWEQEKVSRKHGGPPLKSYLQARCWDEGSPLGIETGMGCWTLQEGGQCSRETAQVHILVTVGQAAVLPYSHGLLLDIVLCEKPRLACHHLLDRCWDDNIIDVIIRLPWLPLLGWDNLWGQEGYG